MKPMLKPIALTASLLLATLSLYANDPQSKPKEAAKTQPAAPAQVVLSASNAPGAEIGRAHV